MRPLTKLSSLLAVSLATASAVAACVGDDAPGTMPGPTFTDGGDNPRGDDGSTPGKDGSTSPGNDAGTDSSPGVDSAVPPLDVKALPGLRLWLDSTQGLTKAMVGTDIVSWRDSSGKWADGGAGAPDGGAHTAVPVPFNGGGAVYPGVVANGIAGRPSVTFESGPKLAIANHDDFNPGTGDFAIAVVGSVSSGTGPFWRLMTASTAPQGVFFGTSMSCSFLGGLGAPAKCTSPEFTPSTSPHVFVVRRKAAQLLYRVDATTRSSYDFAATNPDLGVLTFQQASAFIGGGVVGQISELVFIVTPTDATSDKLEAHLKTKYAIP